MKYVQVEEVSKALDTLSKFLNVDDMSFIHKRLAQGITDFYDNQSTDLGNADCKALGIANDDMLNESAFDNAF